MANGIEVEDLPQFTTRSELMKKVNRISKYIWNGTVKGPCMYDEIFYEYILFPECLFTIPKI